MTGCLLGAELSRRAFKKMFPCDSIKFYTLEKHCLSHDEKACFCGAIAPLAAGKSQFSFQMAAEYAECDLCWKSLTLPQQERQPLAA